MMSTLQCEYCHKTIERKKSYVLKHKHFFCSRSCRTESHNTIISCEKCHKTFRRITSQSEKNINNYCSAKCKYASQKGISVWKNTERQQSAVKAKKSVEHKSKISKSHLGIQPTVETRKKLSEAARKKIITPEHKMHMRLAIIKRIESRKITNESFSPRLGNHEKQIIDVFQRNIDHIIIRQFPIKGYFIDGYCPILKLAIEIDEPIHFIDGVKATQLKEKDLLRQQYLENVLGCTFIRIPVGYSQ